MNVLLLDAHPDEGRYASHLLDVYREALPSGAQVTLVALRDLAFEPNLAHGYRERTEWEPDLVRLAEALDEAGVEIVCLAGYMRLLTATLVGRYAGRMLNIHPSLLPAFPGLDTHARALAAGVKLHGCTVHLVTERMDEGPILAQAAVPVLPGDTEDALAARVLAQEHLIYPMALRRFIEGNPTLPAPGAALRNPEA